MEIKEKETKAPIKLDDERPVRLEQWSKCEGCWGKPWPHFHGMCYNHPILADGTPCRTSQLITQAGNIAVCKSRTWHLGRPA